MALVFHGIGYASPPKKPKTLFYWKLEMLLPSYGIETLFRCQLDILLPSYGIEDGIGSASPQQKAPPLLHCLETKGCLGAKRRGIPKAATSPLGLASSRAVSCVLAAGREGSRKVDIPMPPFTLEALVFAIVESRYLRKRCPRRETTAPRGGTESSDELTAPPWSATAGEMRVGGRN